MSLLSPGPKFSQVHAVFEKIDKAVHWRSFQASAPLTENLRTVPVILPWPSVADPGFPKRWGVPIYYFGHLSRKLHEIEKNWTDMGAPPIGSTNVLTTLDLSLEQRVLITVRKRGCGKVINKVVER